MPVVMLHSYLANAFMWTPQIVQFSKKYRIVVPDLWGHGLSGSLPAGSSDLSMLAVQTLALLDILDIKEYILIGLSIGGMLAGEIALMTPDRVKGLVIMNTYLGPEPSGPQAHYLAILEAVNELGYWTLALLDEIVPMFFNLGRNGITQQLASSFRSSLIKQSTTQIRESLVPIGRMIFTRPDMRHRLREIRPASKR
ncbi:MAG: alpha/beta fold hydrolase [Glaciimonas sp.]|nr:alpha/beta fold hydrolase [Glaciimonas sp.]